MDKDGWLEELPGSGNEAELTNVSKVSTDIEHDGVNNNNNDDDDDIKDDVDDGGDDDVEDDNNGDGDDDEDDESEILESSPCNRYHKRKEQVKYRDVPGIDVAHLALDSEDGVEVVWNEATFSSVKKFKALEQSLRDVFDALALIDHPNVAKFHKYWIDDIRGGSNSQQGGVGGPRLVFITEYMSSGSLKQFLRKTKKHNRKVQVQSWKRWCIQILSALNHLHTTCDPPIVHGNLNCDTIFIQHNGLVKVASVAPDIIHHNVKTCRDNLKNLHFYAPEWGEDRSARGPPIDIYAFGMTALQTAALDIQPSSNSGGSFSQLSAAQAPSLSHEGSGAISPFAIDATAGVVVTEEAVRRTIDQLENPLQQDFIRKCLHQDPAERPSARDLLFHPVLFEVHPLKLLVAHVLVQSNSGDSLASVNGEAVTDETIELYYGPPCSVVATVGPRGCPKKELKLSDITITEKLEKFMEDVKFGIFPLTAYAPSRPTRSASKSRTKTSSAAVPEDRRVLGGTKDGSNSLPSSGAAVSAIPVDSAAFDGDDHEYSERPEPDLDDGHQGEGAVTAAAGDVSRTSRSSKSACLLEASLAERSLDEKADVSASSALDLLSLSRSSGSSSHSSSAPASPGGNFSPASASEDQFGQFEYVTNLRVMAALAHIGPAVPKLPEYLVSVFRLESGMNRQASTWISYRDTPLSLAKDLVDRGAIRKHLVVVATALFTRAFIRRSHEISDFWQLYVDFERNGEKAPIGLEQQLLPGLPVSLKKQKEWLELVATKYGFLDDRVGIYDSSCSAAAPIPGDVVYVHDTFYNQAVDWLLAQPPEELAQAAPKLFHDPQLESAVAPWAAFEKKLNSDPPLVPVKHPNKPFGENWPSRRPGGALQEPVGEDEEGPSSYYSYDAFPEETVVDRLRTYLMGLQGQQDAIVGSCQEPTATVPAVEEFPGCGADFRQQQEQEEQKALEKALRAQVQEMHYEYDEAVQGPIVQALGNTQNLEVLPGGGQSIMIVPEMPDGSRGNPLIISSEEYVRLMAQGHPLPPLASQPEWTGD